jgi:hypothetical protein
MRHHRGYWTKEKCFEEALKYKSRNDFKKFCRQAYTISCENKWIDKISQHMTQIKKPNSYWTFEKCKEIASNYNYKTDYIKHAQSAYKIAKKNNWNDEICSHMIILGDKYKRLIYAYEFSDNYVYVGLTFNINKRNAKHLSITEKKLTPVAKHIVETNTLPKLSVKTEYLPTQMAQNVEKFYILEYKNNGWILLNKLDGGGLGASKYI